MFHLLIDWFSNNSFEVFGAFFGILYIVFSIRQNIFTWPTGLLTSAFYIVVFYLSGLYAAMGLQLYYVFISIYGWYFWIKGNVKNQKIAPPVRQTGKKLWVGIIVATGIFYFLLLIILSNYTDSNVPHFDAFTTALSISATWMLAKKYIEHWIIWVFVDFISIGLYVYKNLWPTALLFLIYMVMAVAGYIEWRKDLNRMCETVT